MDISKLTIEQLNVFVEQVKAAGYDQFILLNQTQNNLNQTMSNLNLIQAEIEKRKQAAGGKDNEVTKGE